MAAEQPDMNAILEKIKALEQERAEMQKNLDTTQSRLGKMQEAKKAEMNHVLDNVIKKYVDKIQTTDESQKEVFNEKKQNFWEGMKRLADTTQEDSGIWQVMVCASQMEELRASEMEKMRLEYDEMKKQLNGRFGEEIERTGKKRRQEEEPEVPGRTSDSLWDDWKLMMEKEFREP
jgi:hypothetical protein